jgi:tetratricopeptide (TPR) repeat protein
LIQVLVETKRYDKAIENANAVLKADPASWKMKTTLVRVYQKSGQTDKVNPAIEAIQKEYPENAEVLYELGLIRWDQKRLDETEAFFRHALKINAEYAEAANSLGYLFAEQNKNIDEALSLIQQALKLKPNAPHIIDSLGWVYYQKAEYAKALELFESIVKKMDNDPVIYDHMADTYKKLNRLEDARKNYEKALAKSKDKELSEKVKEKLETLKTK